MAIVYSPSPSALHQPATTNHWEGERYFKFSDQQKLVADLLLQQYQFRETDHVLDVGCGDGKITAEIAQRVPYGAVLGIDPSHSMISFAHSKFAKNNIRFQIGKASEVSFSHTFDVITAFSSLHWEPRQKEALECFKEALKPGGTILLAIPGPDFTLRNALKEVCQSSTWISFFKDYQSPGRIWTANEYAQLLLETGFIIQKIEVVTRTHHMDNETMYKGLLLGMLPHLAQLPKDRHEQFVGEVVEAVKRNGGVDPLGRMKFEVRVLEIIAHSPVS